MRWSVVARKWFTGCQYWYWHWLRCIRSVYVSCRAFITMLPLRQPLLSCARSLPKQRLSAARLHRHRSDPACNSYWQGRHTHGRGRGIQRCFHASSALRNPDYYSILGGSPSDSKEELKKKYRKLAKKYHPDMSTEEDAKDKFQQVSEAWECLKDDNERTLYDSYGHEGYIAYKRSGKYSVNDCH